MDDVRGRKLSGVKTFGRVLLLLEDEGRAARTNLIELHAYLILEFVQFGDAALELRSHAIKIIYNLPKISQHSIRKAAGGSCLLIDP